MGKHELDDASLYMSGAAATASRRSRRRKQAMVGAAGLAAVLGGGYFLTEAMTTVQAIAPNLAGPAPAPDPTTGSPSSAPAAAPRAVTPSRPARSAVPVSRTPSPSVSATAGAAARVDAAASAAGPPTTGGGAATVTDSGSLVRDGATMRIRTARYDLAGQYELAWAADDGERVGNARCTQNLRLAGAGVARERPTMLLCWHTSAGKSVITLATTRQGRPSKPTSAATVDEQWARLG